MSTAQLLANVHGVTRLPDTRRGTWRWRIHTDQGTFETRPNSPVNYAVDPSWTGTRRQFTFDRHGRIDRALNLLAGIHAGQTATVHLHSGTTIVGRAESVFTDGIKIDGLPTIKARDISLAEPHPKGTNPMTIDMRLRDTIKAVRICGTDITITGEVDTLTADMFSVDGLDHCLVRAEWAVTILKQATPAQGTRVTDGKPIPPGWSGVVVTDHGAEHIYSNGHEVLRRHPTGRWTKVESDGYFRHGTVAIHCPEGAN